MGGRIEMVSGRRTPPPTLAQMDSIIICCGPGISIAQFQQLYARVWIPLKRENLGSQSSTGSGGGSTSGSEESSSSSSSSSGGAKQGDWRKLKDKKQRPTMGVSANRKRREAGPSRAVASRERSNRSRVSCLFCGKVTKHLSRLEAHLRTHTKEKPYSCSKCPLSFSQPSHLKSHIAHQHDHAKKRLKCHHCGKRFYVPSALHIHVRRHLGEKPYRCDVCGKEFVTRADMKAHKMQVHSSAKPFKSPSVAAHSS